MYGLVEIAVLMATDITSRRGRGEISEAFGAAPFINNSIIKRRQTI